MNEPLIKRMKRRGRRWLPLVLLLVAGWFVVAYAPIFPYSLTCYELDDYSPVDLESSGKFSEVFVDGFTDGLHRHGVNYLYYNGIIMFQSSVSGFGREASSKRSDIQNMSRRLVRSLVDEKWGADVKLVPEHIRKLAEESRDPKSGDIQGDYCKLMHAVAIVGW